MKVVSSDERPVPLEMLFLFPDGLISPLSSRRGLVPKVKKYVSAQAGGRRRRGARKLNFGDIIKVLREFDLLPTIFFLKSRMDCDQALLSCYYKRRSHDQRDRLRREENPFCANTHILRDTARWLLCWMVGLAPIMRDSSHTGRY